MFVDKGVEKETVPSINNANIKIYGTNRRNISSICSDIPRML